MKTAKQTLTNLCMNLKSDARTEQTECNKKLALDC